MCREIVGQRRILGTPEVDQGQVRAGLGELERDAASDPACRAGDDRVFPF